MRVQHKHLLRLIREELRSIQLPIPMSDVPDDEYEMLESTILSNAIKFDQNVAIAKISQFISEEFEISTNDKQRHGVAMIVEKVQRKLHQDS